MAIPTRYINAGPLAAQASAGPAMAAGEATARVGQAIQNVGEMGLQIAEKTRKIKETGTITAFMAQADEEAGRFAIDLAKRSDTDAWPSEWRDRTTDLRERAKSLGLSPDGQAVLDNQFTDWSSTRSIHFETQAATKALGIARGQTTQSLQYYASRGDTEGFNRTLGTAKSGGLLTPDEVSKAEMEFKGITAGLDMDRAVKGNPQSVIDTPTEKFLETMPDITIDQVERAKREAEHLVQKNRGAEMDRLQDRLETGEIKAVDLEAAEFLTPRDRHALAKAMEQVKPPTNEEHAQAWTFLDTLRTARNDPSITPEQYRSLWNEGRSSVLAKVAPAFQGDLKKELSYLSPAGRADDPETISRAYDATDLEAIGREAAFRAREAGVFGNDKDEDFQKREAVFRKAEDIRLEVKKFISSNPSAGVDQVREFTDKLIGVKIDGDSSLLPAVPPAFDFSADIERILKMPGMPTGNEASGALLPPKP